MYPITMMSLVKMLYSLKLLVYGHSQKILLFYSTTNGFQVFLQTPSTICWGGSVTSQHFLHQYYYNYQHTCTPIATNERTLFIYYYDYRALMQK